MLAGKRKCIFIADEKYTAMTPATTNNFAVAFEQYRSQLKTYLYRLTAHREDTEDLLQDTYLRAAEKLSTLEERSSLKAWLFTIATNLGRDYLRKRRRWPVTAMDKAKEASIAHPE